MQKQIKNVEQAYKAVSNTMKKMSKKENISISEVASRYLV